MELICHETPISPPTAPAWFGWNLLAIGGMIGAIGVGLSAVPWGVFFVLRWIARGFSRPGSSQ